LPCGCGASGLPAAATRRRMTCVRWARSCAESSASTGSASGSSRSLSHLPSGPRASATSASPCAHFLGRRNGLRERGGNGCG
jgi:hypothetical protein